MVKDTVEIVKNALSLPAEARAALADSLLESLDTEVDEGAEQQWRAEIRRRLAELASGSPRTIPWSEARARLNQRAQK